MPAIDPHRCLAHNERRLLPIGRLHELIDKLVEHYALQAWQYQLGAAQRPLELFSNAANMMLGVIGMGVALGPFIPVVAEVAAVVGIIGGTVSVISGISLIRT
jgi:hypothetical protein